MSEQNTQAEKFRELASALDKPIADKTAPRLMNTHRRREQAMSVYSDGVKLMKLQEALVALADAHQHEEVPESLAGVTTKAQVELLLMRDDYPSMIVNEHTAKKLAEAIAGKAGISKEARALVKRVYKWTQKGRTHLHLHEVEVYYEVIRWAKKNGYKDWYSVGNFEDMLRLARAGIVDYGTYDQARADLLALVTGEDAQKAEREAEARRREAEAGAMKIDGYYPTPSALVVEMLKHANIKAGMQVLEPSAGKGNIADAIRERHPEALLDVVEISPTLQKVLEDKGYEIMWADFFDITGARYDAIVMNPPFENLQDIRHVVHAYANLRGGGRIVAIMSEAPFYRQDKVAVEFREWLGTTYFATTPLGDAFKNAERATGVHVRMVVIEKPMGNETEDAPIPYPFPSNGENRFKRAPMPKRETSSEGSEGASRVEAEEAPAMERSEFAPCVQRSMLGVPEKYFARQRKLF